MALWGGLTPTDCGIRGRASFSHEQPPKCRSHRERAERTAGELVCCNARDEAHGWGHGQHQGHGVAEVSLMSKNLFPLFMHTTAASAHTGLCSTPTL